MVMRERYSINSKPTNQTAQTNSLVAFATSRIMSSYSIPSVCIPRVHYKMNDEDVARVFNEVFGQVCVDHVDMVERQDRRTGYPFYIAYVHFSSIQDTKAFEESGGVTFLNKINADQEVRLVYRDPWFWKVRKNTKTKHNRKGPRILTDEDTEDFMNYQKKVLARRRRERTDNPKAADQEEQHAEQEEHEEDGEIAA